MKDILLYLPSKILPGALAILTISILTRSLSVEEFGKYSYLLAMSALITVSIFSWLVLGVNRHYFDENNIVNNNLRETALSLNFMIFIVLVFILGFFDFLFDISSVYYIILLIGWLNGLFDLLQQANILEKNKKNYTLSVMFRPSFVSLTALVATYFEFISPSSLLIAICSSYIFSCFFIYYHAWKGVGLFVWHQFEAVNLFRYGFPLVLNFGLIFIVSSSDKLLISYYLTEKELGMYSASYDLFSQIVFGFGSVLTLVLFPNALKAYNKNNKEFKTVIMTNIKQALMYLGLLLGFLFISSSFIIDIGLSSKYHLFANDFFEIIVSMTALYCLHSYVFIPILQLNKELSKIIICSIVMALSNIIINILFLKSFGIKVGIYSTLISYLLGFILCLYFTRHVWLNRNIAVEPTHD